MAKKNKDGEQLKDVARNIGSTLGDTVAKANRVVKGVKAAAKAGKEAYIRSSSPKPAKRKRAARKTAS